MQVLLFWFHIPGATHATHWLFALTYGVFEGQTHCFSLFATNPGGHPTHDWEAYTYHELGGQVKQVRDVAFQNCGALQETQRLLALSSDAVGGQMHLNSVG